MFDFEDLAGQIALLFVGGGGGYSTSGGEILVNLGGEGEVAGAVNVQGDWIMEATWRSSQGGRSLTELQAAGNEFVIADNTALPFSPTKQSIE